MLSSNGDTILVERSSYYLALEIFRDYKLRMIDISMDQDGMNMIDLQTKLDQLKLQNIKPAFIYTIPTYSNPCGATLSHLKRQQLVTLAEKYDFKIIADEVYQMLNFEDERPPPLPMSYYDHNKKNVISLGTFSKILSPGLRFGWLHTKNENFMARVCNYGLLQSGGGLNPFTSSIIFSVLQLGYQAQYLQHLKEVYKNRCNVMCNALEHHFPSTKDSPITWVKPEGGYFVWVQFQDTNIDTEDLLKKANEMKSNIRVGFTPGKRFSTSGHILKNYLRLCFACYDEKDIEMGIEVLAKLISSL